MIEHTWVARATSAGRQLLLVAGVTLLAACGGGSGGNSETGGGTPPTTPPTTPPVTPTAPTITTAPQSVAVDEGATARFEVVVSGGTAPIAYQWQRNGEDIAGATAASLVTAAVTAADNGAMYRVVVSNAAGSQTTAAATLTVNAPTDPFGALTFTGPGAGGVGTVDNRYTPTSGAVALANGPVCSGASCGSSLALRWQQGASDQLYVQLLSTDIAAPGATPGRAVNGISITLSPGALGVSGLSYSCIQCDLAALGIRFDPDARTLQFEQSALPNGAAAGGPTVVLDGTLRY